MILINSSKEVPERGWCPMCGEHNRRFGAVVPWFVCSTGKHVCSYGVCTSCADKQHELDPESLGVRENQERIEKELVNKYPDLIHKLPLDYFMGELPIVLNIDLDKL